MILKPSHRHTRICTNIYSKSKLTITQLFQYVLLHTYHQFPEQAVSQYLRQWWPSVLLRICVIRPRWVEWLMIHIASNGNNDGSILRMSEQGSSSLKLSLYRYCRVNSSLVSYWVNLCGMPMWLFSLIFAMPCITHTGKARMICLPSRL